MRIIMLGTHRGTNDGHTVRRFTKGLVYDSMFGMDNPFYINDRLAADFIRLGYCREKKEKSIQLDLFKEN